MAAGFAVVAVGAVAAVLLLRPAVLLGFSDEELSDSLDRRTDAGSLGIDWCDRAGHDGWRCHVMHDANDSETVEYEVTERSRGCWRARRAVPVGRGSELPARVSGCVRLQDYVHILD